MLKLLGFKRDEPTRDVVDIVERLRDTARRHKIRCPACQWQPGSSSRWFCTETQAPEYFSPGCGTSWNTFETHGICPGCSHQWSWTACLQCGTWSKHGEWYAPEDE